MTGLDNALINAVAPVLTAFLFIGYLKKRDESMERVLKEMSDTIRDLGNAIQSHKLIFKKDGKSTKS